MRKVLMGCVAALVAAAAAGAARAELAEIVVAQQYGVAFLPLMVMEKEGLVEKRAAAAGLKDLKVTWAKVAGPSVMNDGLLSGTMHVAAQGAPSMITLWDRTRGNIGIKAISALTTYPLYLITRNPAVKSIRDFTSADKIAVPSVKISTQAIMLQIAAAEAFGDKEWQRLDPFTITLSHPDAVLAITNGTAGVNAHFSSSPFYEAEMKLPGMRLITTNYALLGGPATAIVLTATSRFRDQNPKAYRAFYDGVSDAIAMINRDKGAAARIYLEVARDTKTPLDEIVAIISDKDYAYTLQPQKVVKTAAFMAKVGTIRNLPKGVEDLFFPEAAGLGGD